MVLQIQLTQGKVASIDDRDYARVSKYKWHALLVGCHWYARRRIGPKYIFMHSFILETDQRVDHVDGDGLNNTRTNLRAATASQNRMNSSMQLRRDRSSRFKGVSWHVKAEKWMVRIGKDGHIHYLGLFDSETEAARVYDKEAEKLFGEFAHLNFPPA